jgi:hypothetical protein
MPFEQRMDGATQPARREKNQGGVETNVEEGAGGLLLLAAAHETGLLCQGVRQKRRLLI